MPPIDPSAFYNDASTSDVTIKFGNRELKAHKWVLFSQVKYFKALCGPGSPFAEANAKEIELKDDPEHAVDAMLRWIYTTEWYDSKPGDKTPTCFALDVYMTADEYGITALKTQGFQEFRDQLKNTKADELIDVLINVGDETITHPRIIDLLTTARDKRMNELLQSDKFCSILLDDEELTLRVLKQLAEQVSKLRTFFQPKGGKSNALEWDLGTKHSCTMHVTP
jgi:hypothetical protein